MTSLHFHPLRVQAVRADTDDAKVLTFEVPTELAQTFRFEPGQYLTLRVWLDGEDVRRSYSICAAPGEAPRVGVRQVPGGRLSSWLHSHLQVGDVVDVMPPQGRFGAAVARNETRQARHLLAVAGGSGITPLLSILKSALAADDSTRCTLLYGNRSAASTMFKEELEDLKNRYLTRLSVHTVFSREVMDTPLNAGRLDAAKLATFLRLTGPVDQAFVCGPHRMNDEVEAALLAAGLMPQQLHIERFGIPPELQDSNRPAAKSGGAASASITLVRDGVSRTFAFGPQDTSILAAAARAGLEVPYSCRSGVCATCRARLTDGQVRMDRNFALEKAEVAAGFVLTCQAHPLTPQVTVSFDER